MRDKAEKSVCVKEKNRAKGLDRTKGGEGECADSLGRVYSLL